MPYILLGPANGWIKFSRNENASIPAHYLLTESELELRCVTYQIRRGYFCQGDICVQAHDIEPELRAQTREEII